MCGLEPKDKTEKGSFSPTSVTSSLRETQNCISVLFDIRNGKRQQSEKEGRLLGQHFSLKHDCRFIPVSSAQTLIMSVETITSQTEVRDSVQTSSIEKPVQETFKGPEGKITIRQAKTCIHYTTTSLFLLKTCIIKYNTLYILRQENN